MFRKLIVAAVVGGLAVAAVKCTKLGRYAWHEVRGAWAQAENDIPLEKQIAMLEEDVKVLDSKTIPKKIHELAEIRAERQLLDQQVATLEKSQKATQEALAARLKAIKEATGHVSVDGKPVPVAEALAALERDTRSWELGQQTLTNLRTARDQAKQNGDVLGDQLKALVAQKEDLSAKIQVLKTKLRQVRLQQMKSDHQADDGELARLKAATQELEKKVLTEEQKQAVTTEVYGAKAAPPAAVAAPVTTSVTDLESRINGSKPAAAPTAPPKAGD